MKAKIEKSSFKISNNVATAPFFFFFNTTSYLYISLCLLVFKYFDRDTAQLLKRICPLKQTQRF